MLIVAGRFEVEPEEREAFIEQRHDLMNHSRAEKGCHAYVFCADPIEPGRVILFERWESQEDLSAHLEAMATRGGPPSDIQPKSAEIARYEVSEAGPLGR
ncbi:MAG: putative quinol monooxygenase [Acidimicrobiales bacterium]